MRLLLALLKGGRHANRSRENYEDRRELKAPYYTTLYPINLFK